MHTRSLICLVAGAAAFLMMPWGRGAAAQTCSVTPHAFTESFDDTVYKDPASSVARWGQGEVILSAKGNTFEGSAASVGVRLYVVADGDFDGDGFIDLVGLLLDPDCHLHFLRNRGMSGSPPVHQGFDPGGVIGSAGFDSYRIDSPPGCSTESPALVSGDFDGDGDRDVLYMRVTDESSSGSLTYAYLYQYGGTAAGVPLFARRNVLNDLDDSGLAWHWTSTIADAVDWNGDGRDDLVVASSHGTTNQVLLFLARGAAPVGFLPSFTLVPDVGLATPMASSAQTASGGEACPPAVSRGANALMVGDFDGDGDLDIVAGSTSERHLKYWKNDGADLFSRQADIPFSPGAATLGLVGDFDGDGDLDLMVGRDGWNCNGVGGTVWYFANDGTGVFTIRTTPVVNAGDDLDFGIAFNMDNDPDGTIDVIVADGNNSGAYTQILSTKLSVYNLEGTAVSKAVDIVDGDSDAIVSAVVAGLSATNVNPPDTGITYYLSNDDGQHWEPVMANELPPTSAAHSFMHYGGDLRWKAVLSSGEQALTGDEALLAPASKRTPHLQLISLTYDSVDRRRYTRSGLATGVVSIDGEKHELLVSASYYYPGFQATVTAFDITSLAAGGGGAGLERVDDHEDVTTQWDAGPHLRDTPAANRVIYAAYAAGGTGAVDDRVDFTLAELSAPSSSPSLQSLMAVGDATKAAVVRFVRGRLGDGSGDREWKLFDVGHSSPVLIGAPAGDPTYLSDDYAAFKSTHADREPAILIGANDGMLHAFDARDGAERWALIPHNLLAKVKVQRHVDANGRELYRHDFYVDGSVVVADIYDGSAWKTIAVAGQAQGRGRQDDNYYFAVDITDPQEPLPLWEFTDSVDLYTPCSGVACTTTCEQTCEPPLCSSDCGAASHVFAESGGSVVMEAEHWSSNESLDGSHRWRARSATGGFSGAGYMEARPNNGTNCNNNTTTCGAHMTYQVLLTTAGTYRPYFRFNATNGSDDSLQWGVNGAWAESLSTGPDNGTWAWERGDPVALGPGEYVLDVWMREDGQKLDKVVLTTGGAPAGSGPPEMCQPVCDPPVCHETCTESCEQPGSEWAECGEGAGLECCGTPGDAYCRPIGQCSQAPGPALGETWSTPAVGRVRVGASGRFVVFFGSGYNNHGTADVGRSIYAVYATSGLLLGRWDIEDIPTGAGNPSTIDNTLPAGPALVDVDGDGFVDRLYIGDLEGRLWRLDVAPAASLDAGGLVSNWELTPIFDAGSTGGGRTWAPVITRPAVAIHGNDVNVYFGTGGDDRAPDDIAYRFYSVRDAGDSATRVPADLTIDDLEWYVEGDPGYKYWSDPVIVNDAAVYFASLPGDIESVNPCLSIAGTSKVYGYAIRTFIDDAGVSHPAGQPLFSPLAASSKVRQALVLRGAQAEPWTRPQTTTSATANDVLLQEFAGSGGGEQPAIRRVRDPGLRVSTHRLRIIQWREVPL